MATNSPMISLQHVDKTLGGRKVLDDMSIDVERGEALVIVGGSGVGKSVTLKHIIGLMKPDRGKIIIDGEDIGTMRPVELNRFRRKFGMSFQEGALFDSMSVFENIAFPLRRHTKFTEQQIRDRVDECLELVHLPGVASKRPSELSGGMRRRVGFARAIAHEPEILLFDEPNTGLDPIMTDVIDESILEMRESLHATIVTITHHMPSAQKIGDRIALLFGGKFLFEAPPDEFLRSDNPAVRQFVDGRADGPLTLEDERLSRKPAKEGA